MADREAFFKALDAFVNRPRDPSVIERVKKFAGTAQKKGLVTGAPVFREVEEIDYNPILGFFAPVGYRPLFEQEIVLLMNYGLSYSDVLSMPVHLRKELIKKKVKPAPVTRDRRLDEIPDMPPEMERQMHAARAFAGGKPVTGD